MRNLYFSLFLALLSLSAHAVETSERLGLAPVAVTTSEGVQVSWRWLTRLASGTTFDVYRNGTKLSNTSRTSLIDSQGRGGDTYRVVASTGDEATVKAWDNMFTTVSVRRPSPIKSGNTTGRYRPDDMSVGDLDGDGTYELVLKWLPDNARDSGKDGYASPAILAAYELDGTPLWQHNINIGPNVRSGNHTTQFLVYDFDGDGRAEIICKTAPGTTDGQGHYVSEVGDAAIKAIDNTKTTVNSKGRVTTAEELLTVFEGATGRALHTVWYSPSRSLTPFPTGAAADWQYNSGWGDTSYNRGERYNACVAYLDGLSRLPSAVMQRGYYSYLWAWAVDWDGHALTTRWLHKGSKSGWEVMNAQGQVTASGTGTTSYGQGVHGISVGDVNGDGRDEVCFGSSTLAADGSLLCATGYGHGDAIHLSDLCPDRPGLEVMMPHEEKATIDGVAVQYGYDIHDAATGHVIFSAEGDADNGRGMAADFIPASRGFEFWSSNDKNIRSCTDGTLIKTGCPDTNFRIYWTGDPYDQTFDGRYNSTTGIYAPRILAYNTAKKSQVAVQEFADFGSPSACNTTKATPCLQADIMGDWREELIMFQHEDGYSAADCQLLIYSTPEPTDYVVPCLMEDHVYRMGIAWQNSSYNQPPHLGYYLPDRLGVNGATYVTHVTSHAPTAAPAPEQTTGEETVKAPTNDREAVTGTSFTTATDMLTASTDGAFVKTRTNTGGDTWAFTVNEGYRITKVEIEGWSNNTTSTATIDLTSVKADGQERLASPFTFKAAKQSSTLTLSDLNATQTLVFAFDNSNIKTSAEDPQGKNKQLFARITFTYEKITDPTAITAPTTAAPSRLVKRLVRGQIVIGHHNAAGQQVK